MRKNLVAWQWEGYPSFHQQPLTLWVHLFSVPAFVGSMLSLVASLVSLELVAAGGALVGVLIAFAAQGITHKREPNPAIPFDGAADFVTRILLEQFFTFPRFVVTGRWLRALRGAPVTRSH